MTLSTSRPTVWVSQQSALKDDGVWVKYGRTSTVEADGVGVFLLAVAEAESDEVSWVMYRVSLCLKGPTGRSRAADLDGCEG